MTENQDVQDDDQFDELNCEYYQQCLGFQDESTVISTQIGLFLVVLFLLIASIYHKQSELEHLQFITSNYLLYLYVLCLLNVILILCSVTEVIHFYQAEIGGTLILTSASTMLTNIIGCKKYRSYLLHKKCSFRALKLIGIWSMLLTVVVGCSLLYLSVSDERRSFQLDFDVFLIFILAATVVHTSVSSLASKLSQIEWILLAVFSVLYIESYLDPTYEPFNLFLIYWHPLLVCCVSILAVFVLSPFPRLRGIVTGIGSCFVAMFDLVTDVNVIFVWLTHGHYFWAGLQIFFILSGTLFSGYYVKDYYGYVRVLDASADDDDATTAGKRQIRHDNTMTVSSRTIDTALASGDTGHHEHAASPSHRSLISEYVPSKQMQVIGQIFTFVGLGRLWHGFLGWDSEKNKDLMISSRILKIWELIFESMPTLVLQSYILLLSTEAYDVSILLSMSASMVSVSFTLLRVLYGDHHSLSRDQDLRVGLVRLKNRALNDEYGKLNFSNRNVLALTMMGHSPAQIDKAWSKLKQSKANQHVSQNDAEFQNMMKEALQGISNRHTPDDDGDDNEYKRGQDEDEVHELHYTDDENNEAVDRLPTAPSMNAPKPVAMISVSINGVSSTQNYPQRPYVPPASAVPIHANDNGVYIAQPVQPVHAVHHASNSSNLSAAYHPQQAQGATPAPMTPASPKTQHTPQPSASTTPVTHYKQVPTACSDIITSKPPLSTKCSESDYGGASSAVMMADFSYREKKNRLDWTHPHVYYLTDLGFSKDQIRQAFYMLKHGYGDDAAITAKLKEDDDKFLAYMLHILTEKLQFSPENAQRVLNTNSETIDSMYQNFVCCLCCRVLTRLNREQNERTDTHLQTSQGGRLMSRLKEYAFYFGIYLFVMTDFYCRIFPLLACLVLSHGYLDNVFGVGAGILGFVAVFELFMHRFMLRRDYRSFKVAIKWFWTGTFTISYYLLSCMHLTYMTSSVGFHRMFRAHVYRMLLQLLFTGVLLFLQFRNFGHPFGFFKNSIYFFAFNIVLNFSIGLSMKCYMATFETRMTDRK